MDLTRLSLAEAGNLIRTRKVSSVDLVDACLERIRAVNPRIVAYISVYEEQAREVAKAADIMVRAGHVLGPLHGIPISLKDNIADGACGRPRAARSSATGFPTTTRP